MTIPAAATEIPYAGDGVTVSFPITFVFDTAADIKVVLTDSAGAPTALSTGFSISGGAGSTGTCTMDVAPAVGESLTLIDDPELTQPTDYPDNDAFPASAHEAALDRNTRQVKRLDQRVNRSLRVADGDNSSGDDLLLPIESTRAGMLLGFDALGQPIALSGAGGADSALRTDLASTLSGSDGARLVGFRQAATGSTARSTYQKLRRLIDLEDFGAIIDGATSDYSALVSALAYIGTLSKGADLRLPEGISAVASASLAAAALALPNNCRIIGEGDDRSQILVTGATACNLFTALNKTRIRFEGVCLRGNSTATTSSNGMAMDIVQSVAAAAAGENFALLDCGFENFGGDSWVRFKNDSATFTMDGIDVVRARAKSETGNSRDPTSLVVASDMFVFQGQTDGAVGLLQDVNVIDPRLECNHVKNGITFWHSTKNCKVRGGTIKNAGVTGAQDNKAAYAIKVYDNSLGLGGPPPDLAVIDGVTFLAPRSAGVYCAGANRIKVSNSFCSGQTDTVDGTLPKGAFIINGATIGEVEGCTVDDCYGGIVLNGATAVDRLYARKNTILNVKPNGFGIIGENLSFVGKMERVEITDNSVEATGTTTRGIYLRFSSTTGCVHLIVKDNPCVKGVFSCIEITVATVPDVVNVDISNNGIVGVGTSTGLSWTGCSDAETRARLCGNRFTGTWAAAGVGLDIRDSLGLTVKDNEFVNMSGVTTGFAFRSSGAQGRLDGNRWSGIADARRFEASGGEDLGVDTPTWTGVRGDFVQLINPADTTGATWDYVIDGWRYTTAWRAQFTPYQDA